VAEVSGNGCERFNGSVKRASQGVKEDSRLICGIRQNFDKLTFGNRGKQAAGD